MDSNTRTVETWEELFGFSPQIRYGSETRVQCPECTPTRKPEHRRDKDFSIARNGETGYCHHCGFAANIKTGGGPMGAMPEFKLASQVKRTYDRPPETPDFHEQAAQAFRLQLEQRGLDAKEIHENYGVVYASQYCKECGSQQPHMIMPYYNTSDELINHKYRCINKHFRMDPGAERGLYNIAQCDGADVIVIVEGEMDVYAVDAAGWPFAVSVPNGAPTPGARNYSSMFDYLESAEDVIERASRIVLATDADGPGVALREELERRIGAHKVAHVYWPEGIKDANEAYLKLGGPALKQMLAKATPAPVSGVYTGEDLWPEITHALQFGYDTGTPIGLPSIDALYRPTAGHFTVVTGHAGSGKSTVLDNIMVRLATQRQWPIAYFSPEQQPTSRHQISLLEIYLQGPLVQRKGVDPADVIPIEKAKRANEFMSELVSFINPELDDEEPTLNKILTLATAEVYRRGIKGLVIDPWNELEHDEASKLTETQYVSKALQKIRRWGRKHGVHVWLIAHPKKMRSEDGRDAVPGLGDISGSNNFRNKADYGITIHREVHDTPNTVGFYVTKARWRDSASIGACYLEYDPKTNVVREKPRYGGSYA